MRSRLSLLAASGVLALALTACGGGAGGGPSGITSAPKPTPSPTPTPTPASSPVVIFDAPATQQFASVDSSGDDMKMRVRYDAATKTYEVSEAGGAWQALTAHGSFTSDPNIYFAYAKGTPDAHFFFAGGDTSQDYARIAVWGKGSGAYWDSANYTAFGIATPAGSVPTVGSATFAGNILGTSNFLERDNLIGADVAVGVTGAISLAFDFSSGSLAGSMHPYLQTFEGAIDLGAMSFVDTVYASGSTSFSGGLANPVAGTNGFSGVFAGPGAQEVMGRFNIAFTVPETPGTFQGWGAFTGKR